jgi:hypothetical protein
MPLVLQTIVKRHRSTPRAKHKLWLRTPPAVNSALLKYPMRCAFSFQAIRRTCSAFLAPSNRNRMPEMSFVDMKAPSTRSLAQVRFSVLLQQWKRPFQGPYLPIRGAKPKLFAELFYACIENMFHLYHLCHRCHHRWSRAQTPGAMCWSVYPQRQRRLHDAMPMLISQNRDIKTRKCISFLMIVIPSNPMTKATLTFWAYHVLVTLVPVRLEHAVFFGGRWRFRRPGNSFLGVLWGQSLQWRCRWCCNLKNGGLLCLHCCRPCGLWCTLLLSLLFCCLRCRLWLLQVVCFLPLLACCLLCGIWFLYLLQDRLFLTCLRCHWLSNRIILALASLQIQ